MENPYKVLGVAETATDEQIKDVYRDLCKKYHPDLRPEGISEAEAERKMAEINAAYDAIMQSRRGGNSGGGYYSSSSSRFSDIRSLINQGRIAQAEELLDGVPSDARNAEWNFLKGSIYYSRGWFNDAYNHFQTAVNLEPNNPEYYNAFQRMNTRRNGNYAPGGYRSPSYNGGCGSCDGCDTCCTLIACDGCCECLGGDCIPCI